MANVTLTEPAATLEQLQAQLAELCTRLEVLEKREAGGKGAGVAASVPVQAAAAEPRPVPAAPAASGIAEEELLAISAAIGAYLGVRAHIRQIRLLSTTAWAQQGRVSIQASHRLG
jgi:methylmalonyl-CoA carboxyltransferase large subunit